MAPQPSSNAPQKKLPDSCWMAIAVAALMFSAWLPMPWTHHTILRLAGFVASVGFAFALWQHRRRLSYALIATAILFNPIQRIHLPFGYWMVIYLLMGVLFVYIAWLMSALEKQKAETPTERA